jgi:phycocyanobilin lyase beta subunit
VQQLAAAGLEEGVPMLIAALSYNNPGAAVAAVDGLVLIGKPAVQPLLELLDQHNYTARAWAIRALAAIGDPRGLDILLDAAKTDFALSVRRAAARGLGTIHWHEIPLEQLHAAQVDVLDALLLVCDDPEWVVRYAALTGLQALAVAVAESQPDLVLQVGSQIMHMAEADTDLCIRTRARLAQQQLQERSLWPQQSKRSQLRNEFNWVLTLEKLYSRKSQERIPFLPEGDPRRYRQLAVSITGIPEDS